MQEYKVLAVPGHDKRQDGAVAKEFEAMLNRRAAEGWRLLPLTLNGWAIAEREKAVSDANS